LLQAIFIAEQEEVDMQQVTPEEAEARLRDLIKAALEEETVIITQDAEHQVQLVPITRNTHDRVAGSGKGTFTMSDDFDAPLPDFEEYTQFYYSMVIQWSNEDHVFMVSIPEFPGNFTHGETCGRAVERGRDLIESLIMRHGRTANHCLSRTSLLRVNG
jgi:predicted RNase H-like HicB family nuclease